MKKAKRRGVFGIALLLVLALCGLSASGAFAAEQSGWVQRIDDGIVNGGFEDPDYVYDTALANGKWYLPAGTEGALATASRSDTYVSEGNFSLLVEGQSFDAGITARTTKTFNDSLIRGNAMREISVAAQMYSDRADSSNSDNPVAFQAMTVVFTGWSQAGGYVASEPFRSEGWKNPDQWTEHGMVFLVEPTEEGVTIHSGETVLPLAGATDIAAIEIKFYSYDANNAPMRFYLDGCHAVVSAADVTENTRNLALGGGFEDASAVYGGEAEAGAWRANNAVLSSSGEAALGGERALKVAERASVDAGPIYRMDDTTAYNMAVYTRSTYAASFWFYSTETFFSNVVLEIIGYDGTNYLPPVYIESPDKNWGEANVWRELTLNFSVEKTAEEITVMSGGASQTISGAKAIAAVDFHLRGYNAGNQPSDFYVDNVEILRTPVLFGDPNGGVAGAKVSYEVPAGENVADYLAELTEPSREGYRFAGWSMSGTEETAVDAVMGLDDVTVYAVWEQETYTLTFHKNHEDATGETASVTGTSGETVTLTENGFLLEGYEFIGWATSADGSVLYADGDSVVITGNTDLYAVWKKAETPVPGPDDEDKDDDDIVPPGGDEDSDTPSGCGGCNGNSASLLLGIASLGAGVLLKRKF